MSYRTLDKLFEEEVLMVLERRDEDKKKARIDIQDKYVSINDYIFKTSFDELQSSYNVIQQQEKNNEIVKQNQAEQGQVLKENE